MIKTIKEDDRQWTVKSITFDAAVIGDQVEPRGKFYRALSDFLHTQGMEMAGDFLSVEDITSMYVDNDYEFFEDSRVSNESLELDADSTEEVVDAVIDAVKDGDLEVVTVSDTDSACPECGMNDCICDVDDEIICDPDADDCEILLEPDAPGDIDDEIIVSDFDESESDTDISKDSDSNIKKYRRPVRNK